MDKSQANYVDPKFDEWKEIYKFIDQIWGGLAKGLELREFLPRRGHGLSLESEQSYLLRLQTTSLPRSFRDGIEKSLGKFGLAVLSDDALPPVQSLEQNCDGRGTSLDTCVSYFIGQLLKYGCAGLFVDLDGAQPFVRVIPASSICNLNYGDNYGLTRLTIMNRTYEADGYGTKEVKQFLEYGTDELIRWRERDGELEEESRTPLLDANGQPRGEVFAVWASVDPDADPWCPVAPPFVGLAKTCVLQMHKISELDRAETICNMQVLKRYHPEGSDPSQPQPQIVWDPECVVEIPFGGDVRIDEPTGSAIAITHQRIMDRQAWMDRAVDSWLLEKVRTATESALADEAEMSRLELISKSVVSAFSKAFDFVMRLSDRRYNPDRQEAGTIELSGTAYAQVTDEEIALATQDFVAGTLSVAAIQAIKEQQWRSRGYDLPEAAIVPPQIPDQIIEAQ